MKRHARRGRFAIPLIVLFLSASVAQAELSKQDRKTLKKELKSKGTLYARVDLPCKTGRHPYGVYVSPLIEVSPEGVVQDDASEGISASWWHAESTYWGVPVNSPVTFDDADFEAQDGFVEIEVQTMDEHASTVVKFIDVRSVDDFHAAFDHAFAARPLQEEHDDWSQKIKDAIGDRMLIDGMTKRQVFYVTGRPESFDKRSEDGIEVEIWTLRQSKGVQTSFWFSRAGETTGLPESIRFENGKLVGQGDAGGGGFSLDD